MDFESRAQGTIEYLVIIGVVVVVALGVVGVVSDIASTSGVADTQTKAYFGSQTPFAIVESRSSSFPLGSEDSDFFFQNSQIALVLKNNTNERLVLKSIDIGGINFPIVYCTDDKPSFAPVFERDGVKSYYEFGSACEDDGVYDENPTVQAFNEIVIYGTDSGQMNSLGVSSTNNNVTTHEIVIEYESENGIIQKQFFDRAYPIVWEFQEGEEINDPPEFYQYIADN
jgi:hypothetical protein